MFSLLLSLPMSRTPDYAGVWVCVWIVVLLLDFFPLSFALFLSLLVPLSVSSPVSVSVAYVVLPSFPITANLAPIVAGAQCAWAEIVLGEGGAKTDDTVCAATGGAEETTRRRGWVDHRDRHTRDWRRGKIKWDESSLNPRCSTPSLYVCAVILVRSRDMSALVNPLMILFTLHTQSVFISMFPVSQLCQHA